ncbi:polysaccharide deacetylase family protein [Candidatus Sumerlaeota bacterium]|nr:polysaccharide deacetylase family protein [Candidatus Sumerlaeota bacterium]
MRIKTLSIYPLVGLLGLTAACAQFGRLKPIPDKLVVLTFDDSVKSHADFVGPCLKKLGFGATFFITEGFEFPTDKEHYMTWDEIQTLNDLGFEVGNHTAHHASVKGQTPEQFAADLKVIEDRCAEHGIPRPVSFAFPGNDIAPHVLPVLKERGYLWCRRGGRPEFPYEGGRGIAYDPREDHPYLMPSAGDARPDWKLENFINAVRQARDGKIAIIQFHGVPDIQHPWVHTDPAMFEQYMKYLKDHRYTVIALRDLKRYVDPSIGPADPFEVIERRLAHTKN